MISSSFDDVGDNKTQNNVRGTLPAFQILYVIYIIIDTSRIQIRKTIKMLLCKKSD